MSQIDLLRLDGSREAYRVGEASPYPLTYTGQMPRTVYAAAHVVADSIAQTKPWQSSKVDWDATLKFRHHLWGLGLKIAEAMDTSQRGMGLDWHGAKELIKRSLQEAKTVPGADLACGAGTDHLDPANVRSLDDVVAAYEEQLGHVEACGGRAILMASRALCKVAKSKDDYLYVYDRIISQAADKVILHWLGEMFDPHLAGYWASSDVDVAMATCIELINAHPGKIEGIKISLLERSHEEKMRALLPADVKMYTGDDFNYADLIEGDGKHHSHALLGIFDPIAPAAAAAMDCLAKGDSAGYHAILDPTVELSRRIFEAPTQYYKAGVVFLAWLNGFQNHFRMVGGMESARGILHYSEIFRLADRARLLVDPDLAVERMRQFNALNGV
ncbi:hypothetical protein AA309_28095 [Microvirga vignae]|uniref:Dihydrodipicolinate synthase family protein n=1 Tax=Microvirga vignae TaxID=1225564 RepID=A0A0H1R5A7_9HYPH|nr:dihydrodipicolinate synthase family protein [Microvirga vignae]KLK90006.1 hypothetical protein AA309_28095 [Microvirga vignae]